MDPNRLEKPFFLAILIIAVILAFLVFLPELNVLILGAAFAIFFHPIYHALRRKMPREEWIAALVTVLLAAIVIVVPLFIFGYQLFAEAKGLYLHLAAGGMVPLEKMIQSRLGGITDQVASTGNGPLAFFNLNIGQYVTQAVGGIASNAGEILSGVGGVVWTFFLAFFAFYYLLKDGDRLRNVIVRNVPLADERAEGIMERMVGMATSIVRGSLFMAIAWGLVVCGELVAFGVPNPVFWGALGIVAAFIPFVGVSLIIIPAIIYVFLVAGLLKAIIFAVVAFIFSALMENILHPFVIGRGHHIHPFLLLLSVLGGIAFFGPIGLFLGPLILSFFLTLFEVYPILMKG
jgi:predicted PurR-regulated permease PerM